MSDTEHVNKRTMESLVGQELSALKQAKAECHLAQCGLCRAALERVRVAWEAEKQADETTSAEALDVRRIVQKGKMLCYSEEELASYMNGQAPEAQARCIEIHLKLTQCERRRDMLAELKGESSFTDEELSSLSESVLGQTSRAGRR